MSIKDSIYENQMRRLSSSFEMSKSKRDVVKSRNGKDVESDIERAFTTSGLVTRVFDENPFTGFVNIISRKESGVRSYESLTADNLSRMSTYDVRTVMSNSNPYVSAAITDFQEYVKPGWKIYPESHPILDDWVDRMEDRDVSLDGFIDQCSESMFLHGAYFYEAVYDSEDIPQRLVSLDPYSAVYRRAQDSLGQFYELGQRQYNREFVSVHFDPTIEYRPLYAQVGNPYGKTLIDSSLFHIIMVVEFFKAYKDVLQTIVWPALMMRVDRTVLKEVFEGNRDQQIRVAKTTLELLKKELKELKPGAVISQGSEVMEPEMLSGMNRANLGSVQDFIDILDRQIIIALKSNQLLFAKSDSFTETRAMYEMNHYALLVNHAQRFINASITRQMNLALRRNNVSHLVDFRLDRSIFEEERLLAGINKAMQEANSQFDQSISSLNLWLSEAEEAGRLTNQQANQIFTEEYERRKSQMIFKSQD